VAQAVLPIAEIESLFNAFVRPIQWALVLITAVICVVSGVSILVSIYNSMSDRRHELAAMRALGASRGTVMWVVLLECLLLSFGGGLLGWAGGHLLVGGVASPWVEEQTGVRIGILDFAPGPRLNEVTGFQSAVMVVNHVRGYFQLEPVTDLRISTEWLLVPGLLVLSLLVGILPAVTAYRTDVARALSRG
jgi:putative ABC transport system permease protein